MLTTENPLIDVQRERTQRFTIYDFNLKSKIELGRRRGKVEEQAGLRLKLSGKGIVAQTASLERRQAILDFGLASTIENLKSKI